MEDRYVKGLVTAYNRILALMQELDPDNSDPGFNIIRNKIDNALYGYSCMIQALNLENKIPDVKKYIEDTDAKIQDMTLHIKANQD